MLQHNIEATHEVAKVVLTVVTQPSKGLTVTSASTRIDIEGGETCGRQRLILKMEGVGPAQVRTSVNVQDKRILFRCNCDSRSYQPTLDCHTLGSLELDQLGLDEPDSLLQPPILVGQDGK